eukprot:11019504-Karenia_brevis.AAC.2
MVQPSVHVDCCPCITGEDHMGTLQAVAPPDIIFNRTRGQAIHKIRNGKIVERKLCFHDEHLETVHPITYNDQGIDFEAAA